MLGRVTVYSITSCRHCLHAKSSLKNLGVPYVDVSIDEYVSEVRENLKQVTKSNTVPQIFFNEIHVGGNDDLQNLIRNKTEYDKLLEKVRNNKVPDSFLKLPDDDMKKSKNTSNFTDSDKQHLTASELSEELRKLILSIYSKYLSPDGKKVDYSGIKRDFLFQDYLEMTKKLQFVDLTEVTRDEKLAFFINIYNSLVIHTTVIKGPHTNLFGRWIFFNTASYIIGGMPFNLQDIENGVLRANRKGVGMICNPFSLKDSRLQIALEEPEPLIHFALVCGAKSCPPIKTYSSKEVMSQLKLATESFLESDDAVVVDVDKRVVLLSQIFKWYQADFGRNTHEVLQWILQHMVDNDKKQILQNLVFDTSSSRIQVKYLDYDWSSNT